MSLITEARDLLVGRGRELAAVQSIVSAAVAGESAMLLITGAAGIGKTSLAREAVRRTAPPPLLVSGNCLPLQAISVPLHPLRLALRATAAPGADELMRELEVPERAPAAFDAWIDRVATDNPVVILLDDLQWADQSTLDVLVYLAAGPRDRNVVVLATVRREGLPSDHPLQRWLADVLRLPRVGQLALTGLDRPGTEAQLAALLRAAPHQSLVEEVWRTTEGNPYWNRLLVQGLTPDERRLPGDLPTDLVTAIRRVWSALDEPARDLSSLVAVGGRPISSDDLQRVSTSLGWPEVLPALRDATRARVLVLGDSNRYWFDHPLTAQVLEYDVSTAERRRWHAAYAQLYEAVVEAGRPLTLDLAIALTDHHDAAGHRNRAYRWALRSWEVAGSAQSSPELFRLLQRAAQLRTDGVDDDAVSIRQLRQWLWRAAHDRGADQEELTALDDLLPQMDAGEEPLLVSALLVRRMLLRYTIGLGFAETDDVRRAVELAATDPTSWQYAQALAETAHTGLWAGDPEAPRLAELALEIAREARDPGALCLALAANAMKETFAGHRVAALEYARESLDQAVLGREWIGFVMAALWERYGLTRTTDEDPALWVGRRRRALVENGAPHTYVARLAAAEAEAALWSGDWRSCQDRLRVTFGGDPGSFADVTARLTAARLAAWQGRLDEAVAHLERAQELVDEPRRYLNFPYATVRTEVLLANRRATEAYEATVAGLSGTGPWPVLSEWLVPLAARALADSAEDARGAGRSTTAILAELSWFVERYPTVGAVSWDPRPASPSSVLTCWYQAEVARARHDASAARRWQATRDAAASGRAPWLRAYAGWRTAEAMLASGQVPRVEARRVVHDTYALAVQLGAKPILDELRELTRVARMDLVEPDQEPAVAVLPGLTAREREILEHVVRGSTYAEIARSMFISEKTVSSHISNLLRKTGTASRIELSRLVTRVDRTGADHPADDTRDRRRQG
ncbi:helix-turn-helix transcriptional regulator [Microlunatus ginsengisoli]|uniref:Helix-turn-helix transcriptional regulator n=1 Tax=Microlunatus ginsengisoli TaxID=363863 RepID=A0ABP7AZG2_9ACTN